MRRERELKSERITIVQSSTTTRVSFNLSWQQVQTSKYEHTGDSQFLTAQSGDYRLRHGDNRSCGDSVRVLSPASNQTSSNRSTCGSGKRRHSEVSDGATVAHPYEARTG